jgi:hypothetical protein
LPNRASQIGAALTGLLLVAFVAVTLLHSEPRYAGTNSVRPAIPVQTVADGRELCAKGELVPADAAKVEIAVHTSGHPGPPLEVTVRSHGGRVLARGRHAGGYGDGKVGVPIPVQHKTLSNTDVCIKGTGPGIARVLGQANAKEKLQVNGKAADGLLRLAYLRPGSETWLGLAGTIAHRFSLAKTRIAVPAVFWLLLALVIVVDAFAVVTLLRGAAKRFAAVCVLVAVANGFAWSLLVPPLQAFDEPVHVYYGQFLAETYNVPRPIGGSVYSEDELRVIYGVKLFDVVGNRDGRPPWTEAENHALDRALALPHGRVSQGADGGVGLYPPLYYGIGAIGYLLSPWHSLLDRLEAMRLASVLLAGVTALFVCLFVRELAPRPAWAWQAAGLVAAFQPLFGFLSGVFNPDMGLAAGSAVVLYGIARAWRRGLTPWVGALIGAGLAGAFLAKLAGAGLVPGTGLAVLLLAWRQKAWRAVLPFAGAAAAPVAVYVALNKLVWDRPALLGGPGGGGTVTGGTPKVGNFNEMLTFIWQTYLPRLPFMQDRFPKDFPLWDRYFRGWIGRFGWGDYEFPEWVSIVAAVVLSALLIAAVALAVRHWETTVRRWPEWLSYAAIALGLLFLLGYTGYGWALGTGNGFEQGRYLLPLLGLYAAIVAFGLRGLGARAGPTVAAVLVVAAASHSLWAQLLTIARFYG